MHNCTVWKFLLTYCGNYKGAPLRYPFKGTCCGLHSWETATSCWVIRFTMDHGHFCAALNQWLSMAKGRGSGYSCPVWDSSNQKLWLRDSLLAWLKLSQNCFVIWGHFFLQSFLPSLFSTGVRPVSSLPTYFIPHRYYFSSNQSLAFLVPTWCPVFCSQNIWNDTVTLTNYPSLFN